MRSSPHPASPPSPSSSPYPSKCRWRRLRRSPHPSSPPSPSSSPKRGTWEDSRAVGRGTPTPARPPSLHRRSHAPYNSDNSIFKHRLLNFPITHRSTKYVRGTQCKHTRIVAQCGGAGRRVGLALRKRSGARRPAPTPESNMNNRISKVKKKTLNIPELDCYIIYKIYLTMLLK